jgi:hypothetical protein
MGCIGCTSCDCCVDCLGIKNGRFLRFMAYGIQLSPQEYNQLKITLQSSL